MTAKEMFEARAAAWDAAGRPEELLLAKWVSAILRLWIYSAGAKREGVSPVLADHLKASQQHLASDYYDLLLQERERCSGCGETYHVENLGLCTSGNHNYCFRCTQNRVAPNGNRQCPACDGEVVG